MRQWAVFFYNANAEVGCGCALILKYAVTHHPSSDAIEAVASDIDPEAVQYAKSEACSLPARTNGGASVRYRFLNSYTLLVLNYRTLLVLNPRTILYGSHICLYQRDATRWRGRFGEM